jgi:hypothetical protein
MIRLATIAHGYVSLAREKEGNDRAAAADRTGYSLSTNHFDASRGRRSIGALLATDAKMGIGIRFEADTPPKEGLPKTGNSPTSNTDSARRPENIAFLVRRLCFSITERRATPL